MEEIKEEKVQEIPKAKETNTVTSSVTIDFPQFNWGIHAGETKELPEDEEARTSIIGHHFITKTK